MPLNDPDRLVFRPGYHRFSPAARSSAVLMLDQEMSSSDLAFLCTYVEFSRRGSAVMLRHVCFEFLRVGFGRRLPSRLLRRRVEVIRKVFGIGVSDFPMGRKTCVRLLIFLRQCVCENGVDDEP